MRKEKKKQTKNVKQNNAGKGMRLSIRAKIIMMCITIAVVPLFLSCLISVNFSVNNGRATALEQMESRTDSIAQQVYAYVNEGYAVMQSVAGSTDIRSLDPAMQNNILAQTIPTPLKCNFSTILGLRTCNAQQSRFLISAPGCEMLPDPIREGKGYGYLRDGADLEKLMIYKYPEEDTEAVIRWWTSSACVAG